ncbi:MAG: GAF domain-containing sensor histidine kinase [Anaerolineales bacterium]|nr:MAG: GAF domain-containing sensor histidine kinase [Anaerolineales bacterium]
MNQIYQEILSILTTAPGNLTYHLVLAFSIAAALQASLNHWRLSSFPQVRRTVFGLSLLLALRFMLFILAGLAWQGLVNEQTLLPPIDRVVSLLGVMAVLWVWVFPEPNRRADAATLILALLALTAFVLNLIWWIGQAGIIDYKSSLPGQTSEIVTAVLACLGILLLLLRKPNGWAFGLAMLGLLMAGHLAALLLPAEPGDYFGIVRLAQMAAYPLLLALPQRFPLSPAQPRPALQAQTHERRKYAADPKLLQNLLSLSARAEPEKLCATLTSTISQMMLADVCLLLSPPDENGDMLVHCGYDLIREQPLEGLVISEAAAPLVASALSHAQPLRLPASSTSSDSWAFANGFNLPRPGHLLLAPIPDGNTTSLYGLLLLSPHSERSWNNEDQDLLTSLCASLAHLLHPQKTVPPDQELDETRQALRAALSELEELRSERAAYLAVLGNQPLSEDWEQGQAELSDQPQEFLLRLQAENDELRRLLKISESSGSPLQDEQLENELRLALQEVASLKSILSQADQKYLDVKYQIENQELPGPPAQEITSIVQDLRQPMSFILGYTDFLLGETVGILGNLQRKYLERIRSSTQRIIELLNDLHQRAGSENGHALLAPSNVDPNQVIDAAITHVSSQLRQKNITLRIDLSDLLPSIHANFESLQHALVGLLQNAGQATPTGGEISVSAKLQDNGSQAEYLHIQVTDQGGGIPTDQASHIFSSTSHLEQEIISGTGLPGTELSVIKMLIEDLGGRIWVDTHEGQGSTYSVLVPIAFEPDPFPAAQFPGGHPGGLPG